MIRSQQELVTRTVNNTYLVTLVNTGQKEFIHPVKKKGVANALTNAVKNVQFNENVEYCGPVLVKYECSNDEIKLTFSHAEGLIIKGEDLKDLYVYSKNGQKLLYEAKIMGDSLSIFLTSDDIPYRITLGYANDPEHNLYNAAGYLASPFKIEIN